MSAYHVRSPRPLVLSLLPYKDKREQDHVHGESYDFGDFQTHVSRLPKKTSPFSSVGFGDYRVAVVIYELMEGRVGLGIFTGPGGFIGR